MRLVVLALLVILVLFIAAIVYTILRSSVGRRREVIIFTALVTFVIFGAVWLQGNRIAFPLAELIISWIMIAVSAGVLCYVFPERKPPG